MTGKLAMFGGTRTVTLDASDRKRLAWPIVTDAERTAILQVLEHGGFTAVGAGSSVVRALESQWADYTGTCHCAAVSNGTAAIELAIAAAGLEHGAEIVVPALSFIATATAPLRQGVRPVFADIDPRTFTLAPAAAEAAITPRTQAILAVHLHGLPCDMTRLRALADRHGLRLIEDAAQAHGATYQGKQAGALGDIAAFSLNVSKNLPTSGEGGLVTTDDADLHDQVVLRRQFGERIPDKGERPYVSEVIAGNAKLSSMQAAFTRCQLDRLAERVIEREHNVSGLLADLAGLPGLMLPSVPQDRTHAWHMLRFRFDAAAMGLQDVSAGALRPVLQRALRAEGVPLQRYQSMPLPAQPALSAGDYHPREHPVTAAVIDDSLTLQRWHLNPASEPVLRRCAEAFHKVWANLDVLAPIARQAS